MLFTFFITIHVIASIVLVLVILMQASKGKGLAGAFGGAGGVASQMLGARGTASFLAKATVYLAVIFMVNCIILTFLTIGTNEQRSAVQEAMQSMDNQSAAGNLPLVPGSMEGVQTQTDALPTQPAPASEDDNSGQ